MLRTLPSTFKVVIILLTAKMISFINIYFLTQCRRLAPIRFFSSVNAEEFLKVSINYLLIKLCIYCYSFAGEE